MYFLFFLLYHTSAFFLEEDGGVVSFVCFREAASERHRSLYHLRHALRLYKDIRMPMKNGNANMFCEEDDKTLYLRDVTRLVGTRGIGKRRELSGEVINDPHKLKKFLEQKLAMQSTNVTKSFRNLDNDYSGTLDRDEFRNFLENINIHTTESCHNQVR